MHHEASRKILWFAALCSNSFVHRDQPEIEASKVNKNKGKTKSYLQPLRSWILTRRGVSQAQPKLAGPPQKYRFPSGVAQLHQWVEEKQGPSSSMLY